MQLRQPRLAPGSARIWSLSTTAILIIFPWMLLPCLQHGSTGLPPALVRLGWVTRGAGSFDTHTLLDDDDDDDHMMIMMMHSNVMAVLVCRCNSYFYQSSSCRGECCSHPHHQCAATSCSFYAVDLGQVALATVQDCLATFLCLGATPCLHLQAQTIGYSVTRTANSGYSWLKESVSKLISPGPVDPQQQQQVVTVGSFSQSGGGSMDGTAEGRPRERSTRMLGTSNGRLQRPGGSHDGSPLRTASHNLSDSLTFAATLASQVRMS